MPSRARLRLGGNAPPCARRYGCLIASTLTEICGSLRLADLPKLVAAQHTVGQFHARLGWIRRSHVRTMKLLGLSLSRLVATRPWATSLEPNCTSMSSMVCPTTLGMADIGSTVARNPDKQEHTLSSFGGVDFVMTTSG